MSPLSDNTRGAALMMASMAGFTLNDACMKAISAELPLFQAVFLRGIMTVGLMLTIAQAMGGVSLRFAGRDGWLVAMRTFSEIGAAYCFITAIFNMELANATAILQALPLTVTLGAALFFGEPVGWRRIAAILVGFLGVMLIVRPGAAGFNVYSLYALGAVVCVTIRDLVTRRLSRNAPSLAVAIYSAAGVTLFAGIGLTGASWVPVSVHTWMLLAAAAALINVAFLCSIMVMRVGEISFVAPFRYTALLFALLLGIFVFGEIPDVTVVVGSVIVVATGVYTFYRERRRAAVMQAVGVD